MLGYVTADKPELTVRDIEIYNGYYCGLCKAVGENYPQLMRTTLSYDMAFLALLLSSVSGEQETVNREHCILHPIARKTVIACDSVDYAADMLVLLGYENYLDDKRDRDSTGPSLMAHQEQEKLELKQKAAEAEQAKAKSSRLALERIQEEQERFEKERQEALARAEKLEEQEIAIADADAALSPDEPQAEEKAPLNFRDRTIQILSPLLHPEKDDEEETKDFWESYREDMEAADEEAAKTAGISRKFHIRPQKDIKTSIFHGSDDTISSGNPAMVTEESDAGLEALLTSMSHNPYQSTDLRTEKQKRRRNQPEDPSKKYGKALRKNAVKGLLIPAMHRAYRKASLVHPNQADQISADLSWVYAAESAKIQEIEAASDYFADVMSTVFLGSHNIEVGDQKRILSEFAKSMGRWIYLVDAADDMEKDFYTGSYNPYLAAFQVKGTMSNETRISIMTKATELLYGHLEAMANAYELLDIKRNKSILDNVVYLGMRQQTDAVLKKMASRIGAVQIVSAESQLSDTEDAPEDMTPTEDNQEVKNEQ